MKNNYYPPITFFILISLLFTNCGINKKSPLLTAPNTAPKKVQNQTQTSTKEVQTLSSLELDTFFNEIDKSFSETNYDMEKTSENMFFESERLTKDVLNFANKVSEKEWKPLILKSSTNFKSSSSKLSKDGKSYLTHFITNLGFRLVELRKMQPTHEIDLQIEIEGYADSPGTNKLNLELSKKRAESIKKFLKKGFSPLFKENDISLNILTFGFGEDRFPFKGIEYKPDGQRDEKRRICIIRRKINVSDSFSFIHIEKEN